MLETLADMWAEAPLIDAASGQEIVDADGNCDQPQDYRVLQKGSFAEGDYALVRGPSGQLDLYCDDVAGQRLRRNITTDENVTLEELINS
jgi:hypothetical protein